MKKNAFGSVEPWLNVILTHIHFSPEYVLEAQKNVFQQVNDYLEANNYITDGIEDTPPITN